MKGVVPAQSMSEPTKSERRGSERVVVDLWVEEHTDDALYFQRATNLSMGGLFLDRTLPHPAGTRVQLEVRLPGDARTRCGVVRGGRAGRTARVRDGRAFCGTYPARAREHL